MLHEFLTTNRDQLIERCRLKAAQRSTRPASELELACGVPYIPKSDYQDIAGRADGRADAKPQGVRNIRWRTAISVRDRRNRPPARARAIAARVHGRPPWFT